MRHTPTRATGHVQDACRGDTWLHGKTFQMGRLHIWLYFDFIHISIPEHLALSPSTVLPTVDICRETKSGRTVLHTDGYPFLLPMPVCRHLPSRKLQGTSS